MFAQKRRQRFSLKSVIGPGATVTRCAVEFIISVRRNVSEACRVTLRRWRRTTSGRRVEQTLRVWLMASPIILASIERKINPRRLVNVCPSSDRNLIDSHVVRRIGEKKTN